MNLPASVTESAPAKTAAAWLKTLRAYRAPQISRSVFEIFITAGPFFALWILAAWLTSISYLLAFPVAIVAGGFQLRMFLVQHDCAHGAFFKQKRTNDWVGRIVGIFTLTPHDTWQHSHIIHHSAHGNLDHRGVGDVYTLTVEEFNQKSFLGRLAYRAYRHPLVMFGLGPAFLFMLQHRLPIGLMKAGSRYWVSTMATNVAIAGFVGLGVYAFGWAAFLFVFMTTTLVAATAGVWLFYVQHQFEDTVWDKGENWQVHEAALYGSTHYDLPLILRWISANIGIHHVHHLYSRIPYYRLGKVLRDHPELKNVRRITRSRASRPRG